MAKTIYKNDPYRDRLKIVRLGPRFLEDLLFGKTDMVVKNNLPKDTVICYMRWNEEYNSFDVIVKHKDFPKVREGNMLEVVQNLLEIITPEEYWDRKINKLKE